MILRGGFMISYAYTAGLFGIDSYEVTVECHSDVKLSVFEIVGLPDNAIKEAKERVRAAFVNSRLPFPDKEIIVNLAPADMRKEGSSFDLAILVSILINTNQLENAHLANDACFIGELSLSGDIRRVNGVLCMVIAARDAGRKKVFVPFENVQEASVVSGIEVYGVKNVLEIVDHFNGLRPLTPVTYEPTESDNGSKYPDFKDVLGQKGAKRAAEIAAAGVALEYEVGTMMEIPRACLTADEIAKNADFFCFGTNDLTQMTYGFSRDDAGKFLDAYYDTKIFENDPFAKLDQSGVGKLMDMALKLGKPVNPNLHVGICGEHGGDPSSVEFCHKIGLDYVSCSPFRVPIARLAAAQAAIADK